MDSNCLVDCGASQRPLSASMADDFVLTGLIKRHHLTVIHMQSERERYIYIYINKEKCVPVLQRER